MRQATAMVGDSPNGHARSAAAAGVGWRFGIAPTARTRTATPRRWRAHFVVERVYQLEQPMPLPPLPGPGRHAR
ncbi:hypothetical protein ACU686_37950 [Yinghuangia aomiensis]